MGTPPVQPDRARGFTLLELAISLALVTVLLAVLVPALASARVTGNREQCAANLRHFGPAWKMYLDDHDGQFPHVPVQPAWHYAGVRFSSVDGRPFLDLQRPLAAYTPDGGGGVPKEMLLCCPADRGISGDARRVGTGERTAFESFGTSYRANAPLLDARQAGLDAHRGLRRAEIATVASRLVVMGDPVWFEHRHDTGRIADWHEHDDRGNLLFLDGSVKFMEIRPQPRIGPAVFEPMLNAP
jgi:prepilin-type N-terminal cleavage/methylation domain-containing protein/prepilin-type processing-associated H-X9-DG protein